MTMTIKVTDGQEARVRELCERHNIDVTELLNSAFTLFEFMADAHAKGLALGTVDTARQAYTAITLPCFNREPPPPEKKRPELRLIQGSGDRT